MTPDSNYQTDAGRERFSLAFIVASVAMASVTYGIGRYAYGLFLPEIRRDFALDTFTLGLGPLVFGWIAPRIGAVPFFLALAALSVVVLPFFPSRVFDTSAPRAL